MHVNLTDVSNYMYTSFMFSWREKERGREGGKREREKGEKGKRRGREMNWLHNNIYVHLTCSQHAISGHTSDHGLMRAREISKSHRCMVMSVNILRSCSVGTALCTNTFCYTCMWV